MIALKRGDPINLICACLAPLFLWLASYGRMCWCVCRLSPKRCKLNNKTICFPLAKKKIVYSIPVLNGSACLSNYCSGILLPLHAIIIFLVTCFLFVVVFSSFTHFTVSMRLLLNSMLVCVNPLLFFFV